MRACGARQRFSKPSRDEVEEQEPMDQIGVFDGIYEEYLRQIASLDMAATGERLGLALDGEFLLVPFFGISHRVSAKAMVDAKNRRPIHSVCVILAKYLIMCPKEEPPGSEWITYREFKDASPFVGGFQTHAEKSIAESFSGKLPQLAAAARVLAGETLETEVRADLSIRFQALPKVPMLMLFNDRDEDFPAQCTLLFERRAQHYLDMECLAMTGWVLASLLKANSPA